MTLKNHKIHKEAWPQQARTYRINKPTKILTVRIISTIDMFNMFKEIKDEKMIKII